MIIFTTVSTLIVALLFTLGMGIASSVNPHVIKGGRVYFSYCYNA